jgi:SynChlorMet cassette radical SAM/SPASM protein ScmF
MEKRHQRAIDLMTAENRPKRFALNQIYFYLTAGCNLRCRHCWIAPHYQPQGQSAGALALRQLKSVIRQAKPLGLSGVKLTGGEPLLHPDISAILCYIKDEGLWLSMETNGVLCTSELACTVASISGAFVAVSLDGAKPATHDWVRGVPGAFAGAVQGIRFMVEAGLRPQIIMSLLECNHDQFYFDK